MEGKEKERKRARENHQETVHILCKCVAGPNSPKRPPPPPSLLPPPPPRYQVELRCVQSLPCWVQRNLGVQSLISSLFLSISFWRGIVVAVGRTIYELRLDCLGQRSVKLPWEWVCVYTIGNPLTTMYRMILRMEWVPSASPSDWCQCHCASNSHSQCSCRSFDSEMTLMLDHPAIPRAFNSWKPYESLIAQGWQTMTT